MLFKVTLVAAIRLDFSVTWQEHVGLTTNFRMLPADSVPCLVLQQDLLFHHRFLNISAWSNMLPENHIIFNRENFIDANIKRQLGLACTLNRNAWWRHQMEAFSALLALCAGNALVTGEFPSQRPVTRSFNVSSDLRLNKRLSKHSRRRWFETRSRSLWRHCNEQWNHLYRRTFFAIKGCSFGEVLFIFKTTSTTTMVQIR